MTSAKRAYKKSEKGRAAEKRYRTSAKGKVSIKRYNQSSKGKTAQQRFYKSKKYQEYKDWLKSQDGRRSQFKWDLSSHYKLSVEEYAWFWYNQKGLCAICLDKFDEDDPKNIHVDHNHETKEIRGLLCGFCNAYILGGIETKGIEVYKKAFEYLGLEL